jgi:hypothetical protein
MLFRKSSNLFLSFSLICEVCNVHCKCFSWNAIGKYWLRKLDIKFNEKNVVCKCSNVSTLNLNIFKRFFTIKVFPVYVKFLLFQTWTQFFIWSIIDFHISSFCILYIKDTILCLGVIDVLIYHMVSQRQNQSKSWFSKTNPCHLTLTLKIWCINLIYMSIWSKDVW